MATERYNTIINVEYRGQGDVARYVADLQRIASAMSSAQGQLPLGGGTPGAGGPLALPAGTGTPRQGGRFISRERDIEMRQTEFVNALRERIAVERAATQAARQRLHEDRVAAIAGRPGATMSFGPAGNIEIAFERHGRNITSGLAEMDRQINSLNNQLANVSRQFSAQQVNRQTAIANAGALQTFFQQQRYATNATTNVLGGDEILQMIEAGNAGAFQQDHLYRALVQGGINAKFARQLPEEAMVALTGGSYQDFKTRGVFQGHGLAPITIPGYTDNTRVRQEMEAETRRGIEAELRRLETARAAQAPLALGATSVAEEQRTAAQRADEVRRSFELQRTLNDLLLREIAAQQRIAQSRADLARVAAQAPQPALVGAAVAGGDAGFALPANRLPPRPPLPEGVQRRREAEALGMSPTQIAALQRQYPELTQRLHEALRRRVEAEQAATRAAQGALTAGGGGIGAGAYVGGGGGRFGGGGFGGGIGGGFDEEDPDAEFDRIRREIMARLTRETRGASDPVAAAELRVEERLGDLAAARQRFRNSLEYGFGARSTKDRRFKGGTYEDEAAVERDLIRKERGLLTAQESLNRALQARTAAEAAAAAAATKTAAANAQFTSAYDDFIRTRMRTPLALEQGTSGGAMGGFYAQAGPGGAGPGGAAGYRITPEDQEKWTRWMQQAGVIPTPPPPSPIEAAQEAHARATRRVAEAQAAHADTVNRVHAGERAAGFAHARSLKDLSDARAEQVITANRLRNTERSLAGAGYIGGGAGGGGRGGGGGFGGFDDSGFEGWGQAGMNRRATGTSGFSGFMAGFRGNPDRSMAEMLGQTARFSVMYGAMYHVLFALTQTLQATLQEGILFQQAMTDLRIATGRSEDSLDELSTTVGRSAVEAGLAPSQGVELAARSLGLYGATGAAPAVQDQIATVSSQVASRMATGSKKDPLQLQTELAATVNAFQLDPSGQQMVADLDAYMTKKFGTELGSTLETLAQSGSVGQAAGFSLEQQTAVAALMAARTGQTPSAVGGFMAQIFSRGGEGSLVDVAKAQGIDPNQRLITIIDRLADLYSTAAPREQQQISAAFGRGKIQNAAVALLEGWDEVQSRSRAAGTGGALGSADEQWRERMNNVGGQLAILAGLMKEFASELGQSGLLDIIGAGVLVLQEFFTAVNSLLSAWNTLDGTIRSVIAGMGLLLVAVKSETIQRALATRAGAVNILPSGVVGTGPAVMRNAAGAIVPVTAGAKGIAAAGAAASMLLNPITLAVGGLLAIGSLKASADRMQDAQRRATVALSDTTPLETPSDFRARASLLQTEAGNNREATGWLAQGITFGQANNANVATAERLEAEARRLTRVANRIQAEEESTYEAEPTFASYAADDLKEGLDNITASGGTATDRLDALRGVLYGAADAANAAAEAFDPRSFAGQEAGGIAAQANVFAREAAKDFAGLVPAWTREDTSAMGPGAVSGLGGYLGRGAVGATRGRLQQRTQEFFTGGKVQEELLAGIQDLGIRSLGDIDKKAAGDLVDRIAKDGAEFILKDSGADPPTLAAYAKRLKARLRQHLLDLAAPERRMQDPNARFSPEEATSLAQLDVADVETQIGGMQDTDTRGRKQALRSHIQALRGYQRKTDGDTPEIERLIGEARAQLAQAQFEELEGLRRVAMQRARNRAEANEIGRGFLRREINAAIRGGNADLLVEIIQQAGAGARAIARKAIDDAIRVARAALREAQAMLEGLPGLGVLVDPIGEAYGPDMFGYQSPQNRRREQRARRAAREAQRAQDDINRSRKLLDAFTATPSAGPDDDVYSWEGMDVHNPAKAREEARKAEAAKDDHTAWQHAAMAAQAAIDPDDIIGSARAAINLAEANLAAAKTTDDRIAAQRELVQAQDQLDKAYAEQASSLAELRAAKAGGGPVSTAKAALEVAAAQLRSVAQGTPAYDQALAAYYNAQYGMRDAVRGHRANLRMLNSDLTNPLREAQIATTTAAQKLRQDRRAGAGEDVIAQDRVDLRRAQANEEATKFQQRLQSVQTAEELGRISHSRYINYLENERRRLDRIKDRTFQQQDQLNQIDRLLQEAARSMEAQWNFGDIDLPKPYQVRRYLEQTAAVPMSRFKDSERGQGVTYFYINGADTAKVQKIIRDVVGKSGRTRTPQPRRGRG